MESPYLLILTIFILFITFPFTFTIKASYDVIENCGSLGVKTLFLNLFVAKIKRKGMDLLIITQKKNSKIDFEVGEKQWAFIKNFKNEISNKLKIRKIFFYSNLGLENPFYSAMFSSSFLIFISILISRLKAFEPTGKFVHKGSTNFYNNKFSLGIKFRFAVSIYDILYTFIYSILKTKKDDRN